MQELDDLSERFWRWRAVTQPRTRDDIPRLDRPAGWVPQVGVDAIDDHRQQLAAFAAELTGVHPGTVPDRVDHRLLGSALSRVRWELDVLRSWTRPRFYVDQALGPVFDVLLRPGPDLARGGEVVRLLHAVPAVVEHAIATLPGQVAAEFAGLAVGELQDVQARLGAVADALGVSFPSLRDDLGSASREAAAALTGYRRWLEQGLERMPAAQPIGRQAYEWLLTQVACIPWDAARIRDIGRQEADRSMVLELLERNRVRDAPRPTLPADAGTQCSRQAVDADRVRRFYQDRSLLSQPASLRRYLNAPMPPYLEPLRFLGVTDDLTGPGRLDEDAVSYVPDPGGTLPYFYAANARDPRLGIVHEGVHHQQLALSWSNPRPVRRHYYDSGANEGIAFYNEELMLASGLFEDAPHSRVTVYNMMRLRALRVEVDVALAVGDLDIPAAAGVLEVGVPMDRATALEEAAFFAECPGQAPTYQIGKTQLLHLIADAVRLQGDSFDLRRLHDMIWVNGNVPLALLRWELLGLTDELETIGVEP